MLEEFEATIKENVYSTIADYHYEKKLKGVTDEDIYLITDKYKKCNKEKIVNKALKLTLKEVILLCTKFEIETINSQLIDKLIYYMAINKAYEILDNLK